MSDAGLEAQARLDAWRAQGDDRADPVHAARIEALARRAAEPAAAESPVAGPPSAASASAAAEPSAPVHHGIVPPYLLEQLAAAGLPTASIIAERIRQSVALLALPFTLTLSAGVAAGDPSRDLPEEVFQRADQALYRAKAGGRDRVVVDDTERVDR